jgi:Na+/proline symporter
MSCGYGTEGFQCDTIYTLGGTVALARAEEIYALGQKLYLTEFNPTSVNWDAPVPWSDPDTGGIMSEGAGYAMLILFGLGLMAFTVFLTFLERKFSGSATTSEHFNTAGRDIKTGLTAAVIVSQWTWAATLLQSSNVAWAFGLTGPFWYAAGATIQILQFGILAVDIKIRAPNAHTFLELIKVRWGTCAHFTFMYFGLCANLIVSAMLLLGGCAVFNAVANVPIEASSFLIPALTLVYTLVGGLKATFIASYFHTALIFIILIMMVTTTYGIEQDCTDTTKPCTSIGSAGVMWERLQFLVAMPMRFGEVEIATCNGIYYGSASAVDPAGCLGETVVNKTLTGFHQGPINPTVDGNRGGSYLTFMSLPGLKFGIINIIGNYGTVFCDQSYWQSAIAAKPAATHKGYILGGVVWFTIPFALATSLGLAGNALNVALTKNEAGSGLVPPAAAIAMLGDVGGVLIIIQLTMAILSTGSAECIAVSSIMAYDVYRTYLNPQATGKQILLMSRIFVAVWALVMALASIILNEIAKANAEVGFNLTWVYCFMGIWIGSAVIPVACCIYTDKLNATFAIAAACIGKVVALIVWMSVAGGQEGAVNLTTLGMLDPQTYGGLAALLASGLVCAVGCVVAPQNFDWNVLIDGIALVGGDGGETANVKGEDWESKPEFLLAAKAWIAKWAWGLSIFMCVIWPLAAVPFGVFGKSTFQLWAMIAMLWGWICGVVIVILPVTESMGWLCSKLCGAPMPEKALPSMPAETASA